MFNLSLLKRPLAQAGLYAPSCYTCVLVTLMFLLLLWLFYQDQRLYGTQTQPVERTHPRRQDVR